MITLFGATGYTGRLAAQALARTELPGQPGQLPFRLAGRSPEKLERLADSLPGSPEWLVADAARPATLPPLFQGSRVLVNCAGPFTSLGEPLVAQAALNGVHYLDITNELGYVYQVQSYDALARKNGAAIVPACGFEVALADCAVAILAGGGLASPGTELSPSADDKAGPSPGAGAPLGDIVSQPTGSEPVLDEVDVVYEIRGRGSSIGSRRSAVQSLATSWLGYRNGYWRRVIPGREVRRVPLPAGDRRAISFPSSEIVTVPQHTPVRDVRTWLAASWHAPVWAPVLVPAFAWLARGPVGWMVEALISRLFLPPESGLRSDAAFAVRVETRPVEARRGDTGQVLTLLGKGVYELTAEIVAYAAAHLARPGYDRAGVLAPAAALDPQALLHHAVAHWGLGLMYDL
jgi:short subunit dehydrogenase-like uncharacterized protein